LKSDTPKVQLLIVKTSKLYQVIFFLEEESGFRQEGHHLMDTTIYGELIPIDEIERIINVAIDSFGITGEITTTATTTLQTATAALNSPTPIPFNLSFDLDPEADGIAPFASITPTSIDSIIINAWDGIVETLTTNHINFPVDGPVKTGYDFAGWYLDKAFTIPLTNTFRMPARNVTLYARWQSPPLPIQTNQISAGNTHSMAIMPDGSLWGWGCDATAASSN